MSIIRSLFRPAPGQVYARFIQAFCNGSTVYRGDCVVWDTTAPTSQGTSGKIDGKTIAADDFLFVAPCAATAGFGLQAGIVEGKTLHNRDTTTAMDNDGIVIVQTAGIFKTHCQVDATTAAAGGPLVVGGTTTFSGQLTIADATATTSNTLRGNIAVAAMSLIATGATYSRGTVSQQGVTALVRCFY